MKDISYITPDAFFSLSKTSKKIPEDKLNQKKEKSNTQAWDYMAESQIISPNLTINTKYFDPVIPDFGTFLAIKSGTGTGKTHWLINKLIEAYPNCGFFIDWIPKFTADSISLDEKLKKDWYHLQKDLKKHQRINFDCRSPF